MSYHDIEEMDFAELNILLKELIELSNEREGENKKEDKKEYARTEPLPKKEDFEKQVKELIKTGLLDKKFAKGETNGG